MDLEKPMVLEEAMVLGKVMVLGETLDFGEVLGVLGRMELDPTDGNWIFRGPVRPDKK